MFVLDTNVTAFCIVCADPNTGISIADEYVHWVINGIEYLATSNSTVQFAGSIMLSFSNSPPPAKIAVTSDGLLFVANSTLIMPVGGALKISNCFGGGTYGYAINDIVVVPSGEYIVARIMISIIS